MKLDEIIAHTFTRLMARLLQRLAAISAFILFVLVALYHLSVAALLKLNDLYGVVNARLILVAAYAALAILVLGYLYASRARRPTQTAKGKPSRAERDATMAALIESLMLGFSEARRKSRHS